MENLITIHLPKSLYYGDFNFIRCPVDGTYFRIMLSTQHSRPQESFLSGFCTNSGCSASLHFISDKEMGEIGHITLYGHHTEYQAVDYLYQLHRTGVISDDDRRAIDNMVAYWRLQGLK